MAELETALAIMLESIVRRVVREELAAARLAAPGLVTMAEYARRRSISPSTVRNAIRDGRLEATKIGRAVRVRADAVIGKAAQTAGRLTGSPHERARQVLDRINIRRNLR